MTMSAGGCLEDDEQIGDRSKLGLILSTKKSPLLTPARVLLDVRKSS